MSADVGVGVQGWEFMHKFSCFKSYKWNEAEDAYK
jgi:hypothetical protein